MNITMKQNLLLMAAALMGSIGWRSVFVLLGVVMPLLLALSGILMQTANALAPNAKASDPGLDPDLNETSSEQLSPQTSSNDKSPAQAVRTLEFWILFFFFSHGVNDNFKVFHLSFARCELFWSDLRHSWDEL